MGDWQLIETAPRDGTQLLLQDLVGNLAIGRWNSEERGPGASGYVQLPGWIAMSFGDEILDEGWDTGYGYTLELRPVEWMALPDA